MALTPLKAKGNTTYAGTGKKISISLDKDVFELIAQRAVDKNIPFSQEIRNILDEALHQGI